MKHELDSIVTTIILVIIIGILLLGRANATEYRDCSEYTKWTDSWCECTGELP